MTHAPARTQRLQRASRRDDPPAGTSDLIALSKGEPDLDTPTVITDAMVRALHEGWTHYSPTQGDAELRQAITADLRSRFGAHFTADDCLITHGGAAGITSTILATVDHEDTVVVADPTYSLYRDAIALAGGTMVAVDVEPCNEVAGLSELAVRAAELEAELVILCNPVNPSGAVYSREALRALAEGLAGTDALVLVDEAYEAYIYTEDAYASALDIPALHSRLIFCQTFSKTFAMTGWRLGYVLTSQTPLRKRIHDVHKTFVGSLNAAVQRAAITAVQTRRETIPPMLEAYKERRAYVMKRLRALPGVEFVEPLGAFYVFFQYNYPITSVALRDRLIVDYGVELRPGSEFGDAGENRLRLSYTYGLETLAQGIDRLEGAFADLEEEFGEH